MHARPPEVSSIAERLQSARAGSRQALGEALDACRHYLLLVANQQLDSVLRGKVGPSDLVQETFLEAQRDFERFHGTSEEELLAWLRRILLNNVANAVRHFKETDKRNVACEVPFAEAPVQELLAALAGPPDTPATQALVQERDEALRRALTKLPEQARQVIQWRNYELCSFRGDRRAAGEVGGGGAEGVDAGAGGVAGVVEGDGN